MFYFCSLGSNIDPANNVRQALEALTDAIDTLVLSPLIQTEPHGMQSSQPFYNALFWFESDQTPEATKQVFNAIEERLGRDRSNPAKKTSDRPIDLDILYAGTKRPLSEMVVEDPYLAPLTPILRGLAPTTSVISLPFAGKRLGLGAFQISRSDNAFFITRAALD